MRWPSRYYPNAKIPHSTSERFDGVFAAVAYSLHECRLDKPAHEGEFCFTVRPGGPNGKVAAHVDRVLMEDVKFVVRESGIRRIRASKVREVIAFAVGTIRAPSKRNLQKLDLDSAVSVTFNPHKDTTFVLRDDRSVHVYSADWCYFSGRRGVVIEYSSVLQNPAPTLYDLEEVTDELGGCVACDD
jgi:hypothetical protein